jgi:acyl carrier protein
MLDPRLTEIVKDVLGDDDLALDEATVAADVPGWDSLAHINIMVAVEGEFGVMFTSEQLGRFQNLGELQQFLAGSAG